MPSLPVEQNIEKKSLSSSIWFPVLFTGLLWLVKLTEIISGKSFSQYGLYPLDLMGLRGILTSPFIHGSLHHLINNSLPVFVLCWGLFFFYRKIAFKVFFFIYVLHGFWLWFFGRYAYHIGVSGLIYGLAAFLFVSGIIRKNTHLMAISLLVAFLYGSLIWGIFPLEVEVSWEAHLTGLLSGITLAFYYRNYGPKPNISPWKENVFDEYDMDEVEEGDDEYWKINDDNDEDIKLIKD